MIRNKILCLTVMALLCLLSSSCRHKWLYMEEEMSQHVYVIYRWDRAPEANPASMAMYLYDSDYTSPDRYIFSNKTGGEIRAPFGTHHAIGINADNTEWARLRRTENLGTFEVSTMDVYATSGQSLGTGNLPRAKGSEEERMVFTPNMLWGDTHEGISIVPHAGVDTIVFHPQELVCHYIVDIYDVENIEDLHGGNIDASLSGMAEGVNVKANQGTETPVTMVFELRSFPEEKHLHGEFLTFGECATNEQDHYLTLYLILKDGSKWWHSFDVTDTVHTAPDPRHVHIIIHGLPLPDPVNDPTGGLIPNVNDWQEVHIDLPM